MIRKLLYGSFSFFFAAVGISSLALADDQVLTDDPEDLVLEEIIVTATKRSIDIQDVGLSLTAYGKDQIEKRGFMGMGDYLAQTPSVTIQDRGPGRNQFVIRGISANADGYADDTVGLYLGDVPLSNGISFGANGFPDVKLFDVERVEVLRGPQGTLFGSGSMGGAVRIVPGAPNYNEIEGSADATVSDTRHGDLNYVLSGAVNVPIKEDVAALRVSFYRINEAGFIDNRFPGTDLSALGIDSGVEPFSRDNVNDNDVNGVRFSLGLRPTERLTFTLAYLHQKAEARGLPEAQSIHSDFSTDIGLAAPVVLDDYQQTRYFAESLVDEFDLVTLEGQYERDGFEVVYIGSYFDRSISQDRDISAFLRFPFDLFDPNGTTSWSHELRVASTDDQPFQWLVGGFFQNIKGRGQQDLSWGGSDDYFELIFGLPLETAGSLFHRDDRATEEQAAIFGEFSYDLTSSLRGVFGFRWYDYDQVGSGFQDGLLNGGPSFQSEDDLKNSEKGFNPKFALEFRPSEDQLYYAQAAKGFRLGGPQAAAPEVCADDLAALGLTVEDSGKPVRSDSLWSYEFGGKTTLAAGRVTLNGALFYVDWKNIPSGFLLPNCGFAFQVNAGSASSRGAELALSALITDYLTFSLSGSYVDAQLEEDTPAETGLTGFKGDQLPGVPKWSIQSSLNYSFNVMDKDAFARIDVAYFGEFLSDFPEAAGVAAAGDYTLVNLRSGFSLSDQWSMEFFVNNVLDKDAILHVDIELADGRYVPGRPRTIGGTLRYRF